MGNLFDDLPAGCVTTEIFDVLLQRPGLCIERIISTGQASPPGFWFDQARAEWVLLLRGAARLRFEDEAGDRQLAAGDFLYIAPHRRHRVEWTAEPVTLWLAIHFEE